MDREVLRQDKSGGSSVEQGFEGTTTTLSPSLHVIDLPISSCGSDTLPINVFEIRVASNLR